jgi:hypothetical protein
LLTDSICCKLSTSQNTVTSLSPDIEKAVSKQKGFSRDKRKEPWKPFFVLLIS